MHHVGLVRSNGLCVRVYRGLQARVSEHFLVKSHIIYSTVKNRGEIEDVVLTGIVSRLPATFDPNESPKARVPFRGYRLEEW